MPNGKHPKVSLVSGVLVTVFGALAAVGRGTIAVASSLVALGLSRATG